MKTTALIIMMSIAGVQAAAQSHAEDIRQWQAHYKAEFLSDARSPLTAADTGYLRFFPANPLARTRVQFIPSTDTTPVRMATRSGKIKSFCTYGKVVIRHDALERRHLRKTADTRTDTLTIYASLDRPQDTIMFLPFYDETNGKETYGGGRYMDIARSSLLNPAGAVVDFNKAYNPWCVFKEGYSCPIPPAENRVHLAIRAGEKLPAAPLRHEE